jgi:hypothetical protein
VRQTLEAVTRWLGAVNSSPSLKWPRALRFNLAVSGKKFTQSSRAKSLETKLRLSGGTFQRGIHKVWNPWYGPLFLFIRAD